MAVKRYDAQTSPASVERLPNGYLRCRGTIARTGIQVYQDGQGAITRELRLPDEVFHSDALRSFELLPVTNDHPAEALDNSNTQGRQVGSIGHITHNDTVVDADWLLTEATAIAEAEAGKRQASMGYTCDVEQASGVTSGIPGVADGQPYDAIQRNIRGNHVAIVHKGRAGPSVALRLDSGDAIACAAPTQEGTSMAATAAPVVKLHLDGVDYDVPPQIHQVVTQKLTALTQKITALERDVATAQARADQATEELTQAKAKIDDLEKPDRLQKAVRERLELEKKASHILQVHKAEPLKMDGLTPLEIMRKTIEAASSSTQMEGKEPIYIQVRFDMLAESCTKKNPALDSLGSNPMGERNDARRTTSNTDKMDINDMRAAMLQNQYELGNQPLRGGNPS